MYIWSSIRFYCLGFLYLYFLCLLHLSCTKSGMLECLSVCMPLSMSACISCSVLLYKGGRCVICSIDTHNCYILFENYRFLALENVLYLMHFRWNSTLSGIKVTITMFFISFNIVCLCPFIFSLSLFLVCCCI